MSKPADFWSRRKAAVAESDAAEAKARAEAEAAAERDRLADRTDAEILDQMGLKDPDEMQPGDDFSAFLKAAVPDRIRHRALRRLWVSNPVLANLDGLVEYGEDYTDATRVVENMKTAIRLGRGILGAVEEQVAAAEAAPRAAPNASETQSFASETVAGPSCDTLESEEGPEPEPGSEPAEAGHGETAAASEMQARPQADTVPDPEDEEHAPRPRRMRFHFSD